MPHMHTPLRASGRATRTTRLVALATIVFGTLTVGLDANASAQPASFYTPASGGAIPAPSGSGVGSEFGDAVSISADGDVALVGAQGDLTGQGAADVYVRHGGTWVQHAQLTAPDGVPGDAFGWSVALSGDGKTAVVSSPFHDDGAAPFEGAAYVFQFTAGTWSETAELTPADGIPGELFGDAVAISGDGSIVLVGAPGQDVGTNFSQGAAYTFQTTDGWNTINEGELTSSDGQAADAFGTSVALSDDGVRAVVGAPGRSTGTGVADVFTTTDLWNTDTQGATLSAPDDVNGDQFGDSVAISGDASAIAVGAPEHAAGGIAGSGAVDVFASPDGWTTAALAKELAPNHPVAGEAFGTSLALGGSLSPLLVGAPELSSGSLVNAGGAYVFATHHRWADGYPLASLTAADGASGDLYGSAVALSSNGSPLLIGAPGHATADGGTGAVYPYDGPVVPSISNVAPAAAIEGSTVQIQGEGFNFADRVTVGGEAAAFTVTGDDAITVTLPNLTGWQPVTVVTPVGASALNQCSWVDVLAPPVTPPPSPTPPPPSSTQVSPSGPSGVTGAGAQQPVPQVSGNSASNQTGLPSANAATSGSAIGTGTVAPGVRGPKLTGHHIVAHRGARVLIVGLDPRGPGRSLLHVLTSSGGRNRDGFTHVGLDHRFTWRTAPLNVGTTVVRFTAGLHTIETVVIKVAR
jgi:hypothetical protein